MRHVIHLSSFVSPCCLFAGVTTADPSVFLPRHTDSCPYLSLEKKRATPTPNYISFQHVSHWFCQTHTSLQCRVCPPGGTFSLWISWQWPYWMFEVNKHCSNYCDYYHSRLPDTHRHRRTTASAHSDSPDDRLTPRGRILHLQSEHYSHAEQRGPVRHGGRAHCTCHTE